MNAVFNYSSTINLTVCCLVLLFSLVVGLLQLTTKNCAFPCLAERTNLSAALLSWTLWWVTLIAVYAFGDLSMSGYLIALDLGNFALLSSAVLLQHPNAMDKRVVAIGSVLLVFLLFWDATAPHIAGNKDFYRILAFAPSGVLSHIALMYLGVAFYRRFGAYGYPVSILLLTYALLQLPAYTAFFLQAYEAQRDAVFFGLAVLKVPLACVVFVYLLGPSQFRDDPQPNFAEYPPFPPDNVKPQGPLFKLFYPFVLSTAVGLSTSLVSVLLEPIRDNMKKGVSSAIESPVITGATSNPRNAGSSSK